MTPKRLLIASLEHSVWDELKSELRSSLDRLQLRHLLDPTMLLLRELITRAVDTLHYKAFKQTFVETMGLALDDGNVELDALYKAELAGYVLIKC